jgi:hypothetical protein
MALGFHGPPLSGVKNRAATSKRPQASYQFEANDNDENREQRPYEDAKRPYNDIPALAKSNAEPSDDVGDNQLKDTNDRNDNNGQNQNLFDEIP